MTVILAERFSQLDGNLANGWSNDSSFGGSDPIVQVVGNRASTSGSTALYAAIKLHGGSILNTTSVWRLDIDVFAPLIIGDGGVTVVLISNSTFNGWGFFVGNAVHIKKYVAGVDTNITNDGRPNEGAAGNQFNHITMTHTSAGLMTTFVDGVSWNSTTDNSFGAGNTLLFTLQDANSPTLETWCDNLILQDVLTAPPPDILAPRLWLPTGATQRAGTW